MDCVAVSELMHHKAASEFWLKPCGLGGHDVAGVGNVHYLLHADWIQSQCHLHFAGIYPPLQFFQATQAANEVYALVLA